MGKGNTTIDKLMIKTVVSNLYSIDIYINDTVSLYKGKMRSIIKVY